MSVSIEHEPQQLSDDELPKFELGRRWLLPKPANVIEENIAYNPSGIWTIPNGQPGEGTDIIVVRNEPNRSNPGTSHLGKAISPIYKIIGLGSETPILEPFEHAMTLPGEDPSLTRINRRLKSGRIEKVWLLGVVDAQPVPGQPDQVGSLQTRFYAGKYLDKLEHVADGPAWMKDIRIAQAGDPDTGTELHVYGRPQPQAFSGNITYTQVMNLDQLNPEIIAQASYIDEDLLPIGSGIWGGANDIISYDTNSNIVAAHRAWREGDKGRHYEGVLYLHNFKEGTIKELGVIATADMFPAGTVKADAAVDLGDVYFTGGGYNGGLEYLTAGLRDGMIGLGKVVLVKLADRTHLSRVAGEQVLGVQ